MYRHLGFFKWLVCLLMICGLWDGQHALAQSSTPLSQAESKKLSKQAKDNQLFHQIYTEGKSHFEKKEYTKAISKFLRAYRIRSNPNLVYNIARSFEELKQYNNAAKYYEEYLKINPKASDRNDVELSIQTLRRLHQTEGSKKTVGTDPKTPSPGGAIEPPLDSSQPERSRIWEWGLIGGGLALVAGGVYFGMEAADFNDRLQGFKAGDLKQEYLSVRQQRDDAAMLADALWVPGALIVGAGTYFLLTSLSESKESTKSEETSVLNWSISPRSVSIGFSF